MKKDEDFEPDLMGHLEGGIKASLIETLDDFWDIFDKKAYFTTLRKDYFILNINKNELKEKLALDKGFLEYKKDIEKRAFSFCDFAYKRLWDFGKNHDTKELLGALEARILKDFKDIRLLEKYDFYQVLKEYIESLLKDELFLIQARGYKEAATLYEVDRDLECDFECYHIRYKNELLNKEILLKEYFLKEYEKALNMADNLSLLEEEKISFIEENEEELDYLLRGAKISENKLKSIVDDPFINEKRKQPLIKLRAIMAKIKKDKKKLKDYNESLYKSLVLKYASLNEDELKTLIIERKWLAFLKIALIAKADEILEKLALKLNILNDDYDKSLKECEEDLKKASLALKKALDEALKGEIC